MSSSCASKQTRSKKARSSRALKVSLLAGAGAAGVMADEATAGIVTANISGTAGNNTPIYFNYTSGTIGTSYASSAIEGQANYGKFGIETRNVIAVNFNNRVNTASPIASGSSVGTNDSLYAVSKTVLPSNTGYWGVRFSAPGGGYNYGWVEVGYTATGMTFGQAAVETTVNTPIVAGAVPEIDPASAGSAVSLVAGVLAMVEQRRRKRGSNADSLVA